VTQEALGQQPYDGEGVRLRGDARRVTGPAGEFIIPTQNGLPNPSNWTPETRLSYCLYVDVRFLQCTNGALTPDPMRR